MTTSPLYRTRVKFCGLVRPQDVDDAVALGVDAIGFVFYAPSKRYIHPDEAARLRRRLPSWVRAVGLFVNAPMDHVLATVDAVGLDVVQAHGDETPEDLAPLRARGIPYWKALRIGGSVEAVLDGVKADDAAPAGPEARAGGGDGLDTLLRRGRVPADAGLVGRALAHASQAECCLLDSAGPGFGGSGHAFAWDVLHGVDEQARTGAGNTGASRGRGLHGMDTQARTGVVDTGRDDDGGGFASRVFPQHRFILAGGLSPANVGEAIRQVNPFAVDVSSGIQGDSAREKDAVRMAGFMAAVMRADAARLLDNG